MKQFKVRIYAPAQRPVATVTLSDQRECACWLPEPLSAEAIFFVEQIEAESEEMRQRISAALFRVSAPVWKGKASVSKHVRTRGDALASEPYGTPAFWRAVFGLLERETGLTYDLQDYGQMLQEMEAPVIVVQPAESKASLAEALRNIFVPIYAFARGEGTSEGTSVEGEELPTKGIQNDPELLTALTNLGIALADPQLRPTVLAALEAFARAAKSKQ